MIRNSSQVLNSTDETTGMEALAYKIALTQIPGVGPVTARTLVSYCGGVRPIFENSKKALMRIPGVGEGIAEKIKDSDHLARAEAEITFIEKNNITPLFYLDAGYPDRLRHFSDSPVMLYYRGNADLNHRRIVAVVGTRRPGIHGVNACEEIVEGLLPYDVVVISGLAFGIDVTAHRKCLELGIPTIGVLGHGLGRIYPFQHRSIAEKMIAGGGILSEYTSETQPDREHFPMRNRIVAGLCDALIVVETARKGGSMITAQFANNYNKDVFAIPGRLSDQHAQGCNFLIKTHRAALLENAGDIGYVMRWEEDDRQKTIQPQLFVELSEDEKIIVDLLKANETIGFDRLTYESKLMGSQMAAILLELEFKGIIRTLPGKRYTLTGTNV